MLDWATLAAIIAVFGTLMASHHRLETRIAALDAKIGAVDAKFDRKIDDVRRDMTMLSQDIRHDILMLSRDIGRANQSYREEEIATPV